MVALFCNKMEVYYEQDGLFVYEITPDFPLSQESVRQIQSMDDFTIEVDEMFSIGRMDIEWEALNSVLEAVKERFPDMDRNDLEELEEILRDAIVCDIDTKPFLSQEVTCMVVLDAGDAKYDFSLNQTPYDGTIEKADDIKEEAGLYWLCKQQGGYSKEQVFSAITSENPLENPFLESVRLEFQNISSGLTAVVFLVETTLQELIMLNEELVDKDSKKILKISKETTTGLYDFINGGGSLLEVNLQKDAEIPVQNVFSARPDGALGYSLLDCYGLLRTVYDGKMSVVERDSVN